MTLVASYNNLSNSPLLQDFSVNSQEKVQVLNTESNNSSTNILNSIAKLVSKLALPVFALEIFSFLPKVDGGPITEIVCMGLCSGGAMINPIMAAGWGMCMSVCTALGFLPTI